MKIAKVLNNNVVSVVNDDNMEQVVMGRGLAFQKKPGDSLDESKIEKIFTLQDPKTNEKFKTLMREVSMDVMHVVEDIIQAAKTTLGKKLNDMIYVSLTDHINFALQRQKQGMTIKNALLWEIKRVYKEEYEIGVLALHQIQETLQMTLPEDEAGFIALHIVNAELNEEVPNTMNITTFIHDILNVVKYHFSIEFEEESLNYYRFVTHLKYFAQRIFNDTYIDSGDDFMWNMIQMKHKAAAECTKRIKEYIEKKYDHTLTYDEMLYVTIHIQRVVNR